jgi:hypothetical protein
MRQIHQRNAKGPVMVDPPEKKYVPKHIKLDEAMLVSDAERKEEKRKLELQDKEGEVWVPIQNLDRNYSVSNFGRVRREPVKRKNKYGFSFKPARILQPASAGTNLRVQLPIGSYMIKHLVWTHFQNLPIHKKVSRLYHLDGDMMNCHIDNLTPEPPAKIKGAGRFRVTNRILRIVVDGKVTYFTSIADASQTTGKSSAWIFQHIGRGVSWIIPKIKRSQKVIELADTETWHSLRFTKLSNYEISSWGNIKKKDSNTLELLHNINGKPTCKLRNDAGNRVTGSIHILVALAFLGYVPGDKIIFLDDNTANCRVDNLFVFKK